MTGEKLFCAIGGIDDKWLESSEQCEVKKPQKSRSDGRFVVYETKKLLGVRYIWVFLAILLIINSAVAWVSAGQYEQADQPADMINEFYRLYFENSDEFDAYYQAIKSFDAEQDRLFGEAVQAGNVDFHPERLSDKYSTDPDYSDKMMFELLYRSIEAAQGYPAALSEIIDRAKNNLVEFEAMGGMTDSYSYRYQQKVIRLYETARQNIQLGIEYTRGWDAYFSYETVNVFISIMLILLCSAVFASERQNNIEPILRSTKFGRFKTAAAKLIAILILSSLIVLLFSFTGLAVFGLRIGLSSPDNGIQVFSSYALSPYELTVGEYFLIGILIKIAAFAAFAMIIVMLSALFSNYILISLCGLGIYGLNFLLYSIKFTGNGVAFKYLNFVGITAVEPLFSRYRAVNLFGHPANYITFAICSVIIVSIACMLTSSLVFVRGLKARRVVPADVLLPFIAELSARIRAYLSRRKKHRVGRISRNLLGWEVFKTLISTRFIAIVLLLVCIKGISVYNELPAKNSFSDRVYNEYMTTLEGKLTDQKLQYLADERAFIDGTLKKYDDMRLAYSAGELDYEGYRDYLSDYNYAYSHNSILAHIEHHAAYLQATERRTGVRAWFVYDTGWRTLFTQKADLLLYSAILLLMTGVFASEYSSRSSGGGFAQILRSTKNGRKKTFYAKLIASELIAVTMAVSFGAVDIIATFAFYDMPAPDAPLLSIEYFGMISGGMSIWVYALIFCIIRIIAALVLSLAVCALSELLCRYLPVFGATIVLTLLPALCGYFGLSAAENVNFLNLFAATPLFVRSASYGLFGSDMGMLLLWLTGFSLAVLIALRSAKKMYVK